MDCSRAGTTYEMNRFGWFVLFFFVFLFSRAARADELTVDVRPAAASLDADLLRQGMGARPPAVWLAWWCPRPESDAGLRALARLGERTLALAEKVPSNVGGLVSAQGECIRGMFDTDFDRIAGLHGTNDVSWLKTHARGPGWRVLLPPGLRDERLVKSEAPDPFAYSSEHAEVMERLILPLLA
jgi:hypothetical protein